MYQTAKEEFNLVVSRSNQTLSISNKSIETGIEMSNIHDIMVKSVNIKQILIWVNDVTTEIGNIHPPTHPSFVIGSVTCDRYHCAIKEITSIKMDD